MKDFAKAIEAFRAGLAQYPQAPNTGLVRYQLAAALMKSGDLAGAVKELEALLTAAPKGDLADEALLDLGWAYAELKQPDKAMTAFDKLLQQFAQSPFAAEAQFRIGEVRFDQGNYPLAQAAYEKLLATYKGSPLEDEASYKLGWALLKQDKTADAVAPFRVAAEKAGDPAVQADARQQLGACLLKTGQFAEAAKALEPLRAKPAEGQLAATLLLLGQAYLGAEKFEAAGPAFQELLTKAPQDPLAPRAMLGLGRALKGQKKYDEAVTTLTKATGVADKQVAMEAQFELAETRRLQGDMRAAAMEYLKVAILYPDPEWGARSQYAAGLCYEHAQATAEAVKAYKGVLELYKNQTEWVQKAQERLRALE
jgi:tetratricopeptide (TPR) repeat protein